MSCCILYSESPVGSRPGAFTIRDHRQSVAVRTSLATGKSYGPRSTNLHGPSAYAQATGRPASRVKIAAGCLFLVWRAGS